MTDYEFAIAIYVFNLESAVSESNNDKSVGSSPIVPQSIYDNCPKKGDAIKEAVEFIISSKENESEVKALIGALDSRTKTVSSLTLHIYNIDSTVNEIIGKMNKIIENQKICKKEALKGFYDCKVAEAIFEKLNLNPSKKEASKNSSSNCGESENVTSDDYENQLRNQLRNALALGQFSPDNKDQKDQNKSSIELFINENKFYKTYKQRENVEIKNLLGVILVYPKSRILMAVAKGVRDTVKKVTIKIPQEDREEKREEKIMIYLKQLAELLIHYEKIIFMAKQIKKIHDRLGQGEEMAGSEEKTIYQATFSFTAKVK